VLSAASAAGACVTLAALLAMLSSQPLGDDLLVVHGGSMGDSLPVGSAVVARRIPAEEVQPGLVILLPGPAGDTAGKLHRIIELDRSGGDVLAWTQGDANATPDPQPYLIDGTVTAPRYHIPLLGYAMSFIITPAGWLLFALLPAAAVAASMLYRLWVTDQPDDEALRSHSASGFGFPPAPPASWTTTMGGAPSTPRKDPSAS
jgi:signal peptidase